MQKKLQGITRKLKKQLHCKGIKYILNNYTKSFKLFKHSNTCFYLI